MIEQFTEDEIKQLEKELKERKSKIYQRTRHQIIKRAACELGMDGMFMCDNLKDALIRLIDGLTENYTYVPTSGNIPREVRNKIVPVELSDEYLNLAKALLTAMKPYYGKNIGFCENWRAK